MLIMGARDCYQRKTALPANWQKCKIGLIASFTNLTQSNGAPNAEAVGSYAFGNMFLLGLSNGVGVLGQAGNQFVGAQMGLNFGAEQISNVTQWWLGTGSGNPASWSAVNGNGTSVNVSGTATAITMKVTDPTATSQFAFELVLQLDVTALNTLNGSIAASWGVSNTDDAYLMGGLCDLGLSALTAEAGGWWSAGGSPNPVNCQYLTIRWPFNNNRLRIHNMAVVQTQ
jgi:hypothetical protein